MTILFHVFVLCFLLAIRYWRYLSETEFNISVIWKIRLQRSFFETIVVQRKEYIV